MRSRGFFAIGIYQPKMSVNVGSLWRSANILGASFVYTVGLRYKPQASDTMKSHKHIPLFHFTDVEDLLNHLPNSCSLVGVELDEKAQDLAEFKHPIRACYMLGAEDNGIPSKVLAMCHKLIRLRGDVSLNVAVAGSIVAYHRVGL